MNSPGSCLTISPKRIPVAGSSTDLLHDVFASSESLQSFFKLKGDNRQPILLIVNDTHRSTRTRESLVTLYRWLDERQITCHFQLLIATGTHVIDDNEKQAFEKDNLRGTGLTLTQIAWHDGRDPHILCRYRDWQIHPWVAQSQFIMAIGSVEPHYFAGITGAHKTATIGCMGRDDIERNHAFALSAQSDILRLDGNPVFDDIASSVRGLQEGGKHIVAINQIVCGEQILRVAIGDPIDTLYELLPMVEEVYVHKLSASVDWLELRVPLPLGRSMYQADKALKNNHRAVRDGGGIILESPCPDGMGDDAFTDLLRRCDSYTKAVQAVERDGYKLGDHKAVKLRHLTDPKSRGVRIALVTGSLTDAEAELLGMRRFADISSARAWILQCDRAATHGLVIEDAGFVTTAVV